jgi:hypothetical protein
VTQTGTQIEKPDAPRTKVRRIQAEDFQFYVRQIYRLFRVSTMHLLNNDAVTKLVEQTVTHFRQLREAELDRLNILFVDKTVFVNGQLLKADPDVYQLSIKLAQFIQRLGFNELSIAHDVSEDDLRALMTVFVGSWTPAGPEERDEVKFKRVKLRRVKSEVLDLLRVQAVSPRERLVRTCASALIVMRHAWQRLLESQPPSLKSIKRVVQQMVRESNENPIAFQVLARMRNVHDDPAGQAVKQAMVAIAMMRPLTSDVKVLARVAMASLHFDLGRPRALGARAGSLILTEGPLPAPTSEQRQAFPEETVLAGLIAAQIHPEALERVVVAFEAQHIAIDAERVPMPAKASLVDLEPFFVLVARRYTEAMAFDVSTQRHMPPHEAVTWMVWNCRNKVELLITRLLATALRIDVADELFASSAARTQGIPLEDREYAMPGREVVDRAPRPEAATGSHTGAQPAVPRQRAERYDPLQDEELIRRAQSAAFDAVRPPSGTFDTAAPVLRSALSGNEVQDDLLNPFFRERTGSYKTLTSQHRAVPASGGSPTATSNVPHSATSGPPALSARQARPAENAGAPPASREPTGSHSTPETVAAPAPAPRSPFHRLLPPGAGPSTQPPPANPDDSRKLRLAELAESRRLQHAADTSESEPTAQDRIAANLRASRPHPTVTPKPTGQSSIPDTQIRMAALAVAVEASQQRPVGASDQATVAIQPSIRPSSSAPGLSQPGAPPQPSAEKTVVVAPPERTAAAPQDATVYVPMNRANAPSSPYMERTSRPTAPLADDGAAESEEDEERGTLKNLLSDYLKGD